MILHILVSFRSVDTPRRKASKKDPFGARPPKFCIILLHSNGLQDDLLPPAAPPGSESAAAHAPRRRGNPEHGTIATAGNRSRQVDQPVPGRMPNPAPIMQKPARALAGEGARLTTEAGVTGWKIASLQGSRSSLQGSRSSQRCEGRALPLACM